MKRKIRALISKVRKTKRKRELTTIVQLEAVSATAFPGISGHKYRVAVIGAGAMGRDQCLGLQTMPQAEIVAVADRNPGALARLRQQVSLPSTRFYNDAQELLDAEEIDLVCVATNTTSHLAIAHLAIEAGVQRLVVEKPIGNQVAAARQFAQLCRERGVKIAVNHSRRWSNDYAAIKRCIAHGYIGTLRQVYVVPGPGGLAMTGVHFIDLIAYLADTQIAWVMGFLDTVDKPNKRGPQFKDPGGYALLGLANGVRGYLDVSDDLSRKGKFSILQGDAGRIEVDERQGQWHLINAMFNRQTFRFSDTTKPAGYFAKVAAEMLSDVAPSCGAEEGVAALEAVMAVHLSSRHNHKQVFLPLQGKDTELELPFP